MQEQFKTKANKPPEEFNKFINNTFNGGKEHIGFISKAEVHKPQQEIRNLALGEKNGAWPPEVQLGDTKDLTVEDAETITSPADGNWLYIYPLPEGGIEIAMGSNVAAQAVAIPTTYTMGVGARTMASGAISPDGSTPTLEPF